MRMLRVMIVLALTTRSAWAQGATLTPPAGTRLTLRAWGRGDQVYTCKLNGYDFFWQFKAPDARLVDDSGHVIGRHFAGPSWQLNDSSQVVGRVMAQENAPDPSAIPWLLLTVVNQSGHGQLTGVRAVQRLHTTGGKAPTGGCDQAHLNTDLRIPYTAEYDFFGS